MGMLNILCREGDRTVTWDAEAAAAADPEAVAALEEAKRIFDEERRRGSVALLVEADTAKRLETFDPEASRIVLLPRVIGG